MANNILEVPKPNFAIELIITKALTVSLKRQFPKEALKQRIFHENFCSDDHNDI